jgi:hypothetical protein
MFRATRIAVAAVVAVAIGVLPLVLSRCAESCEAHRPSVASTPACHHVTSTGPHIAQVPSSCGHDHSGTTVVAVKDPVLTWRTFDATVAVDALSTLAALAWANLRLPPHSPPDASLTIGRRSLPLRV